MQQVGTKPALGDIHPSSGRNLLLFGSCSGVATRITHHEQVFISVIMPVLFCSCGVLDL
jgi:hypothetical protein